MSYHQEKKKRGETMAKLKQDFEDARERAALGLERYVINNWEPARLRFQEVIEDIRGRDAHHMLRDPIPECEGHELMAAAQKAAAVLAIAMDEGLASAALWKLAHGGAR